MSIKDVKQKYKTEIKDAVKDLKSKDKNKIKRQIPNLITASRLFAPLFIIPPALMGNLPLAGALTCMFAATDGVDGFLARKWHATSDLGRDLDAITDKVFAGTLLITLSFTNPVLLMTLGLEGSIAAINTYSKSKGYEPRTEIIGKVKTLTLSALLLASFVNPFIKMPNGLIPDLISLTAALQVVTAGAYISQYKKAKDKHERIAAIEEIDKNESIEKTEEEPDKHKEKVIEKSHSSKSSSKDDYIKLRKIVENGKNNDKNEQEVVIDEIDEKVIKKSKNN